MALVIAIPINKGDRHINLEFLSDLKKTQL